MAIVAIACLAYGNKLHGTNAHGNSLYIAIGVIVLFVVFGVGAVRSTGRETFRITNARGGPAAASTLRLIVLTVGYILVILGLLQMLNVNLKNLLVGGAITGIVLGIAAQQSLGNFFAGLVLMFARPFVPGQRVIIQSGAMGGPHRGVITESGLIYTTILTDKGPLQLPNSGLLAAAVGPEPDDAETDTGLSVATDTTGATAGAAPAGQPPGMNPADSAGTFGISGTDRSGA
jgi:small-conductance mechanosensitive channel